MALLAFFGFFNVYALRVNLSVAVVAMTEPVETELANGTIAMVRSKIPKQFVQRTHQRFPHIS